MNDMIPLFPIIPGRDSETILVASRNKRFEAQISQTDKVLFCLGACRLSAENGERASLKSVTKKSTSDNFE